VLIGPVTTCCWARRSTPGSISRRRAAVAGIRPGTAVVMSLSGSADRRTLSGHPGVEARNSTHAYGAREGSANGGYQPGYLLRRSRRQSRWPSVCRCTVHVDLVRAPGARAQHRRGNPQTALAGSGRWPNIWRNDLRLAGGGGARRGGAGRRSCGRGPIVLRCTALRPERAPLDPEIRSWLAFAQKPRGGCGASGAYFRTRTIAEALKAMRVQASRRSSLRIQPVVQRLAGGASC
jgi:hypothetical protein